MPAHLGWVVGTDLDNIIQSPPNPAALAHHEPSGYLPLQLETRATVDTETAAHHLSRRPQTLRGWACHEDGPLRPLRVHGRLAWSVADLRRLLGVR